MHKIFSNFPLRREQNPRWNFTKLKSTLSKKTAFISKLKYGKVFFNQSLISLQYILCPSLSSNCCVRIGLDGGSATTVPPTWCRQKTLGIYRKSVFGVFHSSCNKRESFRESLVPDVEVSPLHHNDALPCSPFGAGAWLFHFEGLLVLFTIWCTVHDWAGGGGAPERHQIHDGLLLVKPCHTGP